MFEQNGTIYSGTAFEKNPKQIVFFELNYHVIGEMPNGFQSTGYKPFCGQFFLTSRNGLVLWILKPHPAKGTDAWIENAVPTRINGLTWLVKKMPPEDVGPYGPAKTIESWTLKIPQTPYWLHLEFSGSLESVMEHGAEYQRLLALFHQIVESIKLEPIAPADILPPFILWQANSKP